MIVQDDSSNDIDFAVIAEEEETERQFVKQADNKKSPKG